MQRVVKIEFNPLCCPNTFSIGTVLDIKRQTSKNRVDVIVIEGLVKNAMHRCKLSTYNRCTEELL